ncbi:MAG: alpha-ketoglutarate-dependent dioxygenase AlkB, partial [Acidimicrobiia bacterium]
MSVVGEVVEPITATLGVPGLRYMADFIDFAAHDKLLATVDALPWQHSLRRRVQHYGYTYDYDARTVRYLGPLPPWAFALACRLRESITPWTADQLIVNEYEPGQGIGPHVDRPCFADVIVSLSLGSTCV